MPISVDFAQRLLPILDELVAVYGTPFHIYDARGIVNTHREMTRAFGQVDFKQYFAVKALPNPHVLTLLLQEGSGFDCSSPAELRLSQRVGAAGEDLVFTSNNTTVEEYRLALDLGAIITFDDRSMLDKAAPLPPIVAFRVAPLGSAAGSSLMGDTAVSKFGVPVDELCEAYAYARQIGAVCFGIHGMTCANELSAARAIRAAEDLMKVAQGVSDTVGIDFDYLNVGGGMGIPYRPDDPTFDFDAYAAAIIAGRDRRFGRARPPRILMECGRYVTGPHGVLITRVVNRCRKSKEIVGLDASMSALMRPGFYRGAYHHITIPFSEGRSPVAVDVVGSLCENIDKFAVDRLLPDPREGDIAVIHDTGAHGHAMGFTYNGRLRPAELLLTSDNSVVEIRRAETFEDYIATARRKPRLVLSAAPDRREPCLAPADAARDSASIASICFDGEILASR